MKFLIAVSIFLFISLLAIGCGSSGGGDGNDSNGGSSGTTCLTNCDEAPNDSLIGTWDLSQDEDGNDISSGAVTLIITNTTYDVTHADCHQTGTYTISGTSMTAIVGTAVGNDCGSVPGEIEVVQFTVNSTTLSTTSGYGTQIWKKVGSGSSGGNASLVGTWKLTDFQSDTILAEQVLSESFIGVFTDSTYILTVEGECEVSGTVTYDASSIWLTSTSRSGNDSYCDYHDTPHRLGYSVTSTTLIITEGDVVMTLTRQ